MLWRWISAKTLSRKAVVVVVVVVVVDDDDDDSPTSGYQLSKRDQVTLPI